MARDIDRAVRGALRTGTDGQRNHQLYLRFEADHRNQIWEADHKELSLRVKYDSGVVSPWATLLVDAKSRAVRGWMLTPAVPTANEVLSALIVAFSTDEDKPIGGIPGKIRWDNDTTFTADRVTEFVSSVGALAEPVEPHTPYHKGKIERFNRTVEQLFSSCQPGWVHGPRRANADMFDTEEVLLEWAELVEAFDGFIEHYNNEHEHRGLRGRTPAAAWDADSEPLRTLPMEELLKALPGEERTVGKGGIEYRGVLYMSPDLVFGDRVEVRSLPYDPHRIYVYREGQWLTSAMPHGQLSDDDVDRFFKERGRLSAHINALLTARGGDGAVVGALTPAEKEPLHLVTEEDIRDSNRTVAAFLDDLGMVA